MSLPLQNCLTMASTVPNTIERMMAKNEMTSVFAKPPSMKLTLSGVKISIGYASFARSAASVMPGMSLARGRSLERFSSHWTRIARGKQMMK